MTGESQFTVKEMLAQIVIPDLKAIRLSLESKADRAEVAALESRVAHFEAAEASYVKRTGPVMDEIRVHNTRIDELEKESIRRAGIVERYLNTERLVQENSKRLNQLPADIRVQIEAALANYDSKKKAESDRTFSRRDRLWLSFAALIGIIATIISTVYLFINTTGGHP